MGRRAGAAGATGKAPEERGAEAPGDEGHAAGGSRGPAQLALLNLNALSETVWGAGDLGR